ncbi:MAG TPA: hypothetical protein VF167_08020 [Longimicrobiaceae bacterium]
MRPSLILLVLLSSATPLAAQQQDDALDALLEPGVRVRITIPQLSRWTGRLHSVDSESLTLLDDEGRPGETIQWSETEQVEVSRGHQRVLWTVGGVVLGAFAGVIYTSATARESDPADIGGWMTAAEGVHYTCGNLLCDHQAAAAMSRLPWGYCCPRSSCKEHPDVAQPASGC